jgi:hypothetical protein
MKNGFREVVTTIDPQQAVDKERASLSNLKASTIKV